MGYWDVVRNTIRKGDIILVVLDARMPEISRNKDVERLVHKMGKIMFMVFTKIDLVSQEHLSKLKAKYKDAFFVSGQKNIGMSNLRTEIFIAAKRYRIDLPKVGVVGYPNIGKSAIINALAHRAKTAISPIAGTTRGMQYVRAGTLRVIDSPGVFPYGDDEVKLGLLSAKNPEQLKSPELVACKIIEMLTENNKKSLESLYGVKIDGKKDSYDVMLEIGEKRKFLSKGGVIDENRTAVQIIRDWQKGKLRL